MPEQKQAQKQTQNRITVSGVVGNVIKRGTTKKGQPYVSFQITVQQGPRGGEKHAVPYTVNAFRRLAESASQCINPGDRLIVTGMAKEMLWQRPDRLVTQRTITAEHMGHDLS